MMMSGTIMTERKSSISPRSLILLGIKFLSQKSKKIPSPLKGLTPDNLFPF